MMPAIECRCPACRAPFRGEALCPRCGADLSALMRVIARSYTLRQRAQACLNQHEFSSALTFARDALRLHRTPSGIDLLTLVETTASSSAPGGEATLLPPISLD